MELRDLIVTPFFIIIVFVGAYIVRPYVCDSKNYRYFLPALSLKIIGAIAVGFIYQFYYGDGDTFNYHTRGSRIVWETFIDDPISALELIFQPKALHEGGSTYAAAIRMPFYGDPASYFVIRVASLIDLFTFSTYSATAVIFAVISFAGGWLMFLAFYRAYPALMPWIAAAVFFVPSVFFWGSGILKDTIVMAALGASVFLIQQIFIHRTGNTILSVIGLFLCLAVIFQVKKYVLLCFAPSVIMWLYVKQLVSIRSVILRILAVPMMLTLLIASSYYAVLKIGEEDTRYAIDKLAITAQITAYDIGFYSGGDAGSKYSLGELDGTFGSMVILAPQAINVSLFRPYLWEVKNVLMGIASLESLIIFLLTVVIVLRSPLNFFRSLGEPYILFCMSFAITFAFAVGVSTYNFGTLMRYKIPLLPFYVTGLVLIFHYLKRPRNNAEFDSTE